MSFGTILLIILILALVVIIPAWPHSRSWGYIDGQPLFVEVAESLKIQGIRHKDSRSTRAQLALMGLQDNEGSSNHGIS
jgi:hypothetical protein